MSTSTVVVTGAAGGIGAAMCVRLRADGYRVIGIDRLSSADADDDIVLDLGDLDMVADVGGKLARSEYEIAGLVHCAASQPLGAAGDHRPDTWMDALRVNLVCTDVLAGALRPRLEEVRGTIIVIGSLHGRATTTGIAVYAATKAALDGWVRAAALDFAPSVRVNSVVPGAIDTAKLREGFGRWKDADPAERRRILEQRTPLRRLGAAEEVAGAVSFLLGPDASFITGVSLVVDGGAGIRLGTE